MIDVAADYGTVPTTREDGAALRERVLAEVAQSATDPQATRPPTLIDVEFGGVLAMTPSFADEFFGKMPTSARPFVKTRNLAPPIENLARFCIHNRDNP